VALSVAVSIAMAIAAAMIFTALVPMAFAVAMALPFAVSGAATGTAAQVATALVVLALVLAVVDVVLVTTPLAGLEEPAVAGTAAAVIAWGRDCDSSDGGTRSHKQCYQQTYDTAWLHLDPPSLGLDGHNLFPRRGRCNRTNGHGVMTAHKADYLGGFLHSFSR
jgi:hypothetical protein